MTVTRIANSTQVALQVTFIASGLSLIASTVLPLPHAPKIAALSTASMLVAYQVHVTRDKEDDREQLKTQLETTTQALTESERGALQLQLKLGDSESRALEMPSLLAERSSLLAQLATSNAERQALLTDIGNANAKAIESANAFDQQLTRMTEQQQTQRSEWVAKFDALIADHESELATLTESSRVMERELDRYRDNGDIIISHEKALIATKTLELEANITTLNAANKALNNHVEASKEIVGELQGEFAYLTSDGFAALQDLHARQIAEYEYQLGIANNALTACNTPQKFDTIGDYERADKLISQLFALTGAVLDASEITPVDDGCFEVALNVRDRKARGVAFVKSLTDLGEVLQVECACIEPLKFAFDPQNPHRILTRLRYRKAPVAVKSLPWKSVEQFVALAGKWARVRVTGGSESGKSPMAELIVGAMQRQRGNGMTVSLAFPLTDSVKDNWALHVTHKSLTRCATDAMNVGSQQKAFHVAVLDECDTALADDSALAGAVKELIKTGSHSNVGCVLLGQNANVRQWKGFDRSDFENIVNVHLGSNANHAIENSNIEQALKDKLKGQALKLTTHCETVNAGVDEPDKLTRFALVLDPAKAPYFIEVPQFGTLPFDYREALVTTTTPLTPTTQCSHCGSDDTKANGKDTKGNPRRKCLSCNRTFKVANTALSG